jgi:hypothetical protein
LLHTPHDGGTLGARMRCILSRRHVARRFAASKHHGKQPAQRASAASHQPTVIDHHTHAESAIAPCRAHRCLCSMHPRPDVPTHSWAECFLADQGRLRRLLKLTGKLCRSSNDGSPAGPVSGYRCSAQAPPGPPYPAQPPAFQTNAIPTTGPPAMPAAPPARPGWPGAI